MNTQAINVGDIVNVNHPSKTAADGWEGAHYVIEVSGDDFGLARNRNADYPSVWIHRQRISVPL